MKADTENTAMFVDRLLELINGSQDSWMSLTEKVRVSDQTREPRRTAAHWGRLADRASWGLDETGLLV